MARPAWGDLAGWGSGHVQRFACLPIRRIGLEAGRGLRREKCREIGEILLAQRRDDRIHDLVDALAALEHCELFADVDSVLAREVWPFGVTAVAVDAMARGAHRRLGCAGLDRALHGFLRVAGRS